MIARRSFLIGAAAPALAQPPMAPDFVARSMDGERFTNASLKGKVILIQFWATWCGFCRRDEPAVEDFVAKYTPRGAVVLAVNVREDAEKVRSYLASRKRTPKIVLTPDTNLLSLYPVTGFPTYVIIGRDGRLAGFLEGAGGREGLEELAGRAGLKAAKE